MLGSWEQQKLKLFGYQASNLANNQQIGAKLDRNDADLISDQLTAVLKL